MSTSEVAQVTTAVGTILTALIFAAGYFILIKIYLRINYNMEHQRTANGRPQVIVTDNYNDLPHVSITLKNMADGAAQNLSFEFSAAVTSSDGHVISDAAYFRNGMAFLSPGGEVTCYWDDIHNLIPHLRERGLTQGIDVTTRYQDLASEYYETTWKLNPFIYSDTRWVYHRGMADLVEAVEKLSDDSSEAPERYETEPTTEGHSHDGKTKKSHTEDTDGEGSHREGSGG